MLRFCETPGSQLFSAIAIIITVILVSMAIDVFAEALIDINTAAIGELVTLPGIGEAKATAIIAGRPYAIIEDLLNVKGIGPATFEKLKHLITVGGDLPLPVTFTTLKASEPLRGNGITVAWETATENNTLGFNVYRNERKINMLLILAKGPSLYSLVDEEGKPDDVYKIEEVDLGGNTFLSKEFSLKATTVKLLNVNTASAADLVVLPGIGPVKAMAIVAHRDLHGLFEKLTDLLRVKGIGAKGLAKIALLITVDDDKKNEMVRGIRRTGKLAIVWAKLKTEH